MGSNRLDKACFWLALLIGLAILDLAAQQHKSNVEMAIRKEQTTILGVMPASQASLLRLYSHETGDFDTVINGNPRFGR